MTQCGLNVMVKTLFSETARKHLGIMGENTQDDNNRLVSSVKMLVTVNTPWHLEICSLYPSELHTLWLALFSIIYLKGLPLEK